MATKKKDTVKKAAPKKATVKKTAKKRAYVRKPKAEDIPAPEVVEQAEPGVTLTERELENIKRTAKFEGAQEYALGLRQSKEENEFRRHEALAQLRYLDISDVPKDTRLVLLLELEAMGFVTDRAQSLVTTYFINDILDADVLELNHNNKIVREVPKTNSNFCNSKQIGRPLRINVEAEIQYSTPGDNLPETIKQDGATYIRID